MTRLIEILISLAIVAALFLVVAIILPSQRNLTERVETNRKMTIVFDTLNSLRRFGQWNALTLRDPKAQLKLSGPEAGVGARVDYTSSVPSVGTGSWELTKSEQDKLIEYKLDNSSRGTEKSMAFALTPTGRAGRNVEIVQAYHVKYGWDLIGRYAGLYVGRSVGDDMKLGLQRLSNMLASVPNVDYKTQGSRLENLRRVELPAEDLLVVPAGSIERNNLTIQNSMKSNMEWINRTIAASGLSKAGPMRIVSTELGRDNYTFDVVQPVRRGGGAAASDAAPADEAKEDEAPAEAAASGDQEAGLAVAAPIKTLPAVPIQAAGGAELTDLKLQGPVQYLRAPARGAATATYVGFMAELENVRNALKAWALTQGYEPSGRPYEVYKNGIEKAFNADSENRAQGQFDVYWDLKVPGAPDAPAPAAAPAAPEAAAEAPAAAPAAPAGQ